MKMKLLLKNNAFLAGFSLLAMFALFACNDEIDERAHDPNKPVEVFGISPEEGAAKTRLYITGANFGSDPSRIFVKIGGVNARVIGSDGGVIYCLVPFAAGENGVIEVGVGDDANTVQYVIAEQVFKYKKTRQVKTICGNIDEYGKSEAKDGSFDECGFLNPRWLAVDPQNQHHLYLVDGSSGDLIRVLDTKERTTSTLLAKGIGGWKQIRQIAFSFTGDTLLVANEEGNVNAVAVAGLLRNQNYQQPFNIVTARENNACGCHPQNGELYFNSRSDGSVYRYDWETGERVELFKALSGSSVQLFFFFHPNGKFAYICAPSARVILKSEYDQTTKSLLNPSIFCGEKDKRDYQDGMGTSARLGNPMQGVFVKNVKYEEEGKSDIYDFYFADQYAHAIRYLTPEGEVRTFAGRGSKGLNDDPHGYVDGELLEEARFYEPQGLTFDSENEIFYVADNKNMRIRTISLNAE